MKKILIVSIFVFLSLFNYEVINASGYLAYQDIEFEHVSPRFLDDYTQAKYDKYYEKIDKKKFWGWRVHTAYKTEKVLYTKETLFVIYNEGETAISQTISLKSEESVKKQYNVSGSIELEAGGKAKEFKLGFEQKLDYSVTATTYTEIEEDFVIKVYVDPNTQLFVEIRGEGQISNGVAKYYRFWRGVKKGGWEVFIVTTEYYSLRKEIIDEK